MKKILFSIYLLLGISSASAFENGNYGQELDNQIAQCTENAENNLMTLECLNVGLKLWDSELNKQYKNLLSNQSEDFKNSLKKSQIAWLKYRDLYIKGLQVFYAQQDGSAWKLVFRKSEMNITRDKAIDLYRINKSIHLENEVIINQSSSISHTQPKKAQPKTDYQSLPLQVKQEQPLDLEQKEIIINKQLHSLISSNEKFLPNTQKNINVKFETFIGSISSQGFPATKIFQKDYTNNREAFGYSFPHNIKIMFLVNKISSEINYIMLNVDNASQLDVASYQAFIREIARSLNDVDYTMIDFLEKAPQNSIAHNIASSGNEYLAQNFSDTRLFWVRKK